MKKFLFAMFVFQIVNVKAQVMLEHTYNIQSGNQFYFTDLGNNNYKYFSIDYFNDKFSLYNLDHTPFMLNIATGASLQSGLFTIGYITSTLFDCDSNNIEYVITTTSSATQPFYIYRTDGTLLFQKDSVVASWCFGCYGGISAHPIFNTPTGTKLILVNQTSNDWFVYALCGTLPEVISEIEQGNQYVQLFPNPSSDIIILKISTPSSIEESSLSIYNASFQVIGTESIRGNRTITIGNDKLSSGTYFFSLQTKNKILQTGKFILSK
jgi:hypothetical protein